jgi:multidrug efflux pump subunit AcrA (membrane-fusion protein)
MSVREFAMLDKTKPLPQNMTVPDTREVQNILGARKSRGRVLRLRNLAWLAVAAVTAAGAYVWLTGGSRATVNYVTQNAVRSNLTVIVTATGSAQPITQINVSSELSGTIRKVHVDYNSSVKVGQPLAELDTDKLKATIESVRARLDAARAKVSDTAATIEEKRAEHERKKELLTKVQGRLHAIDPGRALRLVLAQFAFVGQGKSRFQRHRQRANPLEWSGQNRRHRCGIAFLGHGFRGQKHPARTGKREAQEPVTVQRWA